jgi:phosphate transport system permease protein
MSARSAAGERMYAAGGRMRRRRAVNRVAEWSSTGAALLAVAVLLIVVGSVFLKGLGALSWHFLTTPTALFGESGGGIANAIVGSAAIVGIAALAAVPAGILVAIHTTEFASPRVAAAIRFVLDVLNGVPTIVTGIFVYGLIVVPQGHQSGYAAATALAIVMLPIVARTAGEVLSLVPASLKEASHALGIARWRTVVRVTVPTAAGGLLTGALLGVARVAGETAPLLFASSIFSQGVHSDPGQALANIPVFIFQSSESPQPEAHTEAWAAALVLIAIVLALNVLARAFYARAQRHMQA